MFGIKGPIDLLVAMLNVILGGTAMNVAALGSDVETYSASAYETVTAIHNTVVRPVAAVVISMMAVLELARQATHVEGDRDLGVRVIAATMFKVVMLVVVAQNMDLVMGAINGAVDAIMQGMIDYAPDKPVEAIPEEQIREAIEQVDFFDQLGLLVILVVPWLIAGAATVVVGLMVWLRFMELYILTAFATLPMAFMALPDTKPIAIGYLRRYTATALQGAVLILVIVLYNAAGPTLVGGGVGDWENYPNISTWAILNFAPMVFMSVALIVLVLSSGKLARALVGEG